MIADRLLRFYLNRHAEKMFSGSREFVAPQVRAAMALHPGFADIGSRMLMAWAEGVQGLRDERVYAVGDWLPGKAFDGLSLTPRIKDKVTKIGRSQLMGER